MRVCEVEGCGRDVRARGLCGGHYQRLAKYGAVGPAGFRTGGLCAAEGCDRKRSGRGYCPMHYQRVMRDGEPGAVGYKRHFHNGASCVVEGCEKRAHSKQLCTLHYSRMKAHGDPSYLPSRRSAGDGYYIDGYRARKINGRKIYEHRHVMEQMLGRPLHANENVHHINGVRDDNRPENLELWVTSQPSGQRPADLVTWAVEILDRYSPELLTGEPVQLRIVN